MEHSARTPFLIEVNARPWTGFLGIAGAVVVALVVACYLLVIGRSFYFWLYDMPNHLARAAVMADAMFHHGLRYGSEFQYQFKLVPYILGDVALAGAVELLGPNAAAAFWECVTFLSFPCAVLFYLRVQRTPAAGQLTGVLFATVLSSDAFFFGGFIAFRLGLALVLVSVALAVMLRRRRSALLACLYLGVVLTAYLVHFSALVFAMVAIGVTGLGRLWSRETSLKTEALLWLPMLALMLWQFGVVQHDGLTQGTYDPDAVSWGTVREKITDSRYEFRRFGQPADRYLNVGLIVCIAMAGWYAVRRRGTVREWLRDPAVRDCLTATATFFALYFILPSSYSDGHFIDVRAIAAAVIFLVAATLCGSPARTVTHRSMGVAALLGATVLSITNLVALAEHVESQGTWISDYRRLVAAIPQGSHVFPITLRFVPPFASASSSIVIDRAAVIPYLYSGDNGNVMTYFRYLHRPYAPGKTWLVHRLAHEPSPAVDWQQIDCDYDFILAEKPFDRRWVPIEITTIAENPSAVLLRVEKHSCQRRA